MSAANAGVLAVEVGTAGVTAVVVTPQGLIAARGHHQLPQHRPEPGWVEHAPEEIWQATLGATRECLRGWDGSPSDLAGIGITNQRETVLLWDRETLGSPRRAIAGPDRRTSAICEGLRASGHEDRVRALTGLQLDPCFSASKLAWLAENEPHTWTLVGQGRYAVGTVDSFLVARMTRGTWHVTDVSNASRTLLLDLEAGTWSPELCDLFGVPMDALPELVPSWGRLARTDPRSFLGLDLPVSGIAGDQQAALFGQACFDEGDARCVLGPESSVVVNTGSAVVRSDAALLATVAWKSAEGATTYALEGSVPDTGAPVDAATREATGRAVRDVVEALPMPLTSVRVDGPAAADDLLCQLQADLLGVPVLRPEVGATAALGAAYLAGLGAGLWHSTADLRELRQPDRRFEPRRPD